MANRIHNAFDNIKAQPQLVESTKQFISERYRKKAQPIYRTAFQRAFAAVCMVFVLAAGIGGYSWLQTPVSYVSIDVNPSIELALNRLNRVVSITAFNAEGEEILKSLSLKGKNYEDAIHLIVDSKAMKVYLTDENELFFTVAADGSREVSLKSGVESCSSHIGHKCQSVSADLGLVSQAHDQGFSLGKYYIYLQLVQYDDTVTIDECRKMSMAEIHGLINEHEHEMEGEHGQGSTHGKDEGSVDDTNAGIWNGGCEDENSTGSKNEESSSESKNEESSSGIKNENEGGIGIMNEDNENENSVNGSSGNESSRNENSKNDNSSTSHHGGHHGGYHNNR